MNETPNSVLTALENERRYVARELHDGVAQTSLQLGLQVGICAKLLERGKLEMLADELSQLQSRIQLASTQIRDMIGDMRPPSLEPDAGLKTYIEYELDLHDRRGGLPATLHFDWPETDLAFSETQKLTIARVVQEGLQNVRKHAQAENVKLTFTVQEKMLHMTIADNGQGFDPVEVAVRPVDKGGAGLANMRTRIEAMGGSLVISCDEGWTEITARLPISLPDDR